MPARVPDVVIGGAPRSGTTFLCEVLHKHPDVYVGQPFIPEPKVLLGPLADQPEAILERYGALFAPAPPASVLVEKTSYYLENAQARTRFAQLLPSSKIIFILRDPLARAYSNWLWSTKNGLETLPFEDAIRCEGTRPSPMPPERSYAQPFDYVARGRYGSFVGAWIDALGADRVAVYQFEAAMEAPGPFVRDLQTFVGVAALPWERLETGVVNATDNRGDGPQPLIAHEIRQRLAPEMARLKDLTGLDISRWGY